MRKSVLILITFALFAGAVFCAFTGYRNHRIFVRSHDTSDIAIRLDSPGTFAVTVDPPGRSLFRPGGVLEIFVTRDGLPVSVENIILGSGTLRVMDHTGRVCLDEPLDQLRVTNSRRGQYYSLVREFATSGGGPYRVEFEVTEPFQGLEGTLQTLSARHFTSGNEVLIHYSQYAIAALSGGLSLFLVRRIRTANHQA